MNKEEARAILAAEIATLRTWSYNELRGLELDPTGGDVVAPSGARHQVEMDAVWDDKKGANLRVIVSVDDGGWRAFAPLSESFIVAPDGSFVGE
jgi:hypothetical protein